MIERILQFCQYDVWTVKVHELTGVRQFGVKLLRLVLVAAAEFQESFLSIRATSLVYTTLLSLVPFLAVTFSVLKAFGVHQQIEPILSQAFDPLGEKGAEITTNIIQFVENLKVGVLGAVGVAGLFYTTYSLIEKIEEALNSIWRVEVGRPLARRITDYLSVVLVGPVFVFTAFGLMASSQSHWLVQRIMEIQPFGYLIVVLTSFLPFFFMCMLFTFLYKLVPNTPVNISSAFVGGLTAGVCWQIAGMAFSAFVASSSRYSAIYSSFAVLILFLIWLYVGWLIVLAGAQVAYYHQHPSSYLLRLTRAVKVHELTGVRQFGVKLLRLVLVAAAEFQESFLSIRATSLVYTTLLSLVPFLAVTFSVLKAFGVHQQIEPILSQAFDPLGEKGAEITTNIIQFVENLKVGVLGAVGVAGLFYTTYSLIEKIEEALNSIWRVEVGRPLARRITDYLSVVLVGPVFVFTAFGLMASSQSHWLVQRIMEIQPFGYLIVVLTSFLPFFFMCMLFTFLYKLVPNTPVNIYAWREPV